MAKDYEDGVWRTIGGKRIFIKDGEDLATAMKKSGKFKSGKKVKVEGYSHKVDEDYEDRLAKYKEIQKDANKKYDNGEITKEERNKLIDDAHDKYIKQKETIESDYRKDKEIKEPKYFHEGKKDIEEEFKQIYAEEGLTYGLRDSNVDYLSKKYDIPKTQVKAYMQDVAKQFDKENEQKNKALGTGLKDLGKEKLNEKVEKNLFGDEERTKDDSHEESSWSRKFRENKAKTVDEREENLHNTLEKIKDKKALGTGLKDLGKEKMDGEGVKKMFDEGKEKTYKVDTTKIPGKTEKMPERTQEEKASDERYANARAMYKLTGDEKYKKIYQEEISKSTERVREKVSNERLQKLKSEMGSKSFERWSKAYNEYKKEHPESNIDLYKFIKMNKD